MRDRARRCSRIVGNTGSFPDPDRDRDDGIEDCRYFEESDRAPGRTLPRRRQEKARPSKKMAHLVQLEERETRGAQAEESRLVKIGKSLVNCGIKEWITIYMYELLRGLPTIFRIFF